MRRIRTAMDHFKELATKAACLIMKFGRSANFEWELKEIRRCGLQTKLFLVTPPLRSGDSLMEDIKGIEAISWAEFVSDMSTLGYQLDASEPAHGSVFAFDAEAKAFLLTANACGPSQYIEPIQKWVSDKIKVGYCVSVACSKCASRFFITPLEATKEAENKICGSCKIKEEMAEVRKRLEANKSSHDHVKSFVLYLAYLAVVAVITDRVFTGTGGKRGYFLFILQVVLAALPFAVKKLVERMKQRLRLHSGLSRTK